MGSEISCNTVEGNIFSPVATACAELWTAFTGDTLYANLMYSGRNAKRPIYDMWKQRWFILYKQAVSFESEVYQSDCLVWGFTVVTGSTDHYLENSLILSSTALYAYFNGKQLKKKKATQ